MDKMGEELTEGQLFALKVAVALLVALGSGLWWCWTRIQRQIACQLRHPILHQPKVPKVPKVFRDVRRSISSKLEAYRTGFLDEQSRKQELHFSTFYSHLLSFWIYSN